MGQEQKENKKWWQFKKMSNADYGKIAILCFVVVGLKGMIVAPIPIALEMFTDILATLGLISGIDWLIKKFKKNKEGV